MSDLFDAPGSASGGLKWDDVQGNLVLVKPTGIEAGVQTTVGTKDVTVADVIVLDGPGAPTVYAGTFIFPRVMQGQLRANVGSGRYNLGRVGKGTAKPGQSAPWVLTDPTDADKAVARSYLAKQPVAAAAPAATDFSDAPF